MRKLMVVFYFCLLVLCASCTGQKGLTDQSHMKTICLDGVTYYYFTETIGYSGYGFMSVKFNSNGTVNTCKEK